jgi:hypothetical protein
VIAVTEAFGGWGLAGRFEDLEGIVVEAAAPTAIAARMTPQPYPH